MNKKSLGALVALNLVLLTALVVVGLTPTPAAAQFVPRGEFVMISGASIGRQNSKVIYVVDLKATRMAAMIFRSDDNTFEMIGTRDIATDAAVSGGVRR